MATLLDPESTLFPVLKLLICSWFDKPIVFYLKQSSYSQQTKLSMQTSLVRRKTLLSTTPQNVTLQTTFLFKMKKKKI